MKTVTFTYLGAKCEYNFKTGNLHVISKHSFNSPKSVSNHTLSKKHSIQKQDIKSITFKYENTQLPSQVFDYFYNYPNLESIELEKLDFKNVETISGFIHNCHRIKKIAITHKNAENLTSIENLIVNTRAVTSIKIKHIKAPNLKEVEWLLWCVEKNIKEITIENITAPNINFINNLINTSNIKTLDLTKIGNVNVHTIYTLIKNCEGLERLKINPLKNIKEIEKLIENAPTLKTDIISKINRVKKLNPYFLTMTPKNETLNLEKFKDISELSSHLKECISDEYIYPSIKIGRYKLKFSEYSIILENNIPIQDKTEKEIIKEIITQSKTETKENIENLLETLGNKKIFKNEKCKKELTSKLTIIKNLK